MPYTAVDALATERAVFMIPLHQLEPHPGNPRRDVGDISDLTADVAARGVDSPLTVVPTGEEALTPDGEYLIYRVVIGHRRRAAAIAAGLDRVPCIIRTDLTPGQQRQMMVRENVHRADLTPVEEADAYQAMLDLDGLTVEQVAAAVSRSESTVRARIRLRGLPEQARVKVHAHQATLADVERLLDFADHPEHLENLTARLGEADFVHHVARAKREVDFAARVAQVHAELEAQGVRWIDDPRYDDTKVKPLDQLTDQENAEYAHRKPLDRKKHAKCPGHVAWAHGYHPESIEARYGCESWRRHGHHDRFATGTPKAEGPMSEEEKEERRRLIANNKASTAAAQVRHDWLVELLASRRDLSKDAPAYAAGVFLRAWSEMYGEKERAFDLLGWAMAAYPTPEEIAKVDAEITKPARSAAFVVAIAAARAELRMTKDYWRRSRDDLIVHHLRTLAGWGYPLADLEREYLDDGGAE